MAAGRLTNEMRNRIAKAVLEHRFGAEEAALDAARPALGDAIYEALYPTGSVARLHLRASLEGEHYRTMRKTCHFPGKRWVEIELSEVMPFFDKDDGCLGFDANSPATAAFERFHAAERKLQEAKEEASAKVHGILSEATTVKKLMEVWPEVEPFIPPAATPIHLPAVPRDEVNALLGLPTKKEM